MLTIEELKEKLTHVVDELTLIELLGLDIHDLVELLHDEIEENFDELLEELEEHFRY